MFGADGTLVADTTFDENFCCGICKRILGGKIAAYEMSGVVGAVVTNTILEKKFCCGVCKKAFWVAQMPCKKCLELIKHLLRIQHWKRIIVVVYVNTFWAATMPHKSCLELMGRLLRIHHSRRIFVVVFVIGILAGKNAP